MLIHSCSSQIAVEKPSGPGKLSEVIENCEQDIDQLNKIKEQAARIDELINSNAYSSQQAQQIYRQLPDMITTNHNKDQNNVSGKNQSTNNGNKKSKQKVNGNTAYDPAKPYNGESADNLPPLPELLTYDCDVAVNLRNITSGLNASKDSMNDIKTKLDSLSQVLFQLRLECEELKHQFDLNSASVDDEFILLPYFISEDKKPPHSEKYYVIHYDEKLSEIEKVINKYQLKLEKIALTNKKYVNRLKIQAYGFSSFGTYKITESYEPAEYIVKESSLKGDITSAVDSAMVLYKTIKSDPSYKDLNLKFSITVFGYCDTEMPDEMQINSLPSDVIKMLPSDLAERKIVANEKISEARANFIAQKILEMLNERKEKDDDVGICAKGLGVRMPDFSANYQATNMPDPDRRIAKFFITIIAW